MNHDSFKDLCWKTAEMVVSRIWGGPGRVYLRYQVHWRLGIPWMKEVDLAPIFQGFPRRSPSLDGFAFEPFRRLEWHFHLEIESRVGLEVEKME
jgi:hypothetical protein